MPALSSPGLLGRAVSRLRAAGDAIIGKADRPLSGAGGRGWMPLVLESFAGAWQSNVELSQDTLLAQTTVFACETLIAGDIGKLRLKLVSLDEGIWQETASPAFSPVLRRPNRFQTRQQFIEQWIVSKLSAGNTYVLKERDNRGVVVRWYILDPGRVKPLVADDGSVYYQLKPDNLSQVPDDAPAVPASEIIHDRMICLFHPLVGISPLYACALAATQSMRIGNHSVKFFENMARPSGILTAPGRIDDITATRLKSDWERNYGGDNLGRVSVLGDGLEYKPLAWNAVDAQLVEQSKLSAEQVCAAFHVPGYMVGAAPAPPYNNIEALNKQYYGQCLQTLIKAIQSCMNEGLGLDELVGRTMAVQFDLDDLLLMDTATLVSSLNESVAGGWMAPNEARARRNLAPVQGGESPMMQQQNYSLAAIARRDAQADPFNAAPPAPAASDGSKEMRKALETMKRGLANV